MADEEVIRVFEEFVDSYSRQFKATELRIREKLEKIKCLELKLQEKQTEISNFREKHNLQIATCNHNQ